MDDASWGLEIVRPLWLGALLVLPVLVYSWRHSLVHFARWQRCASLGVRCLLIAALLAALGGVTLHTRSHEQFVVFAVDHSLSISDEAFRAARRFVEESLAAAGDNQSLSLAFSTKGGAGEVATGAALDGTLRGGRATDIATALAAARAEIPPKYVPTIVLLSDGNETTGDALTRAKGLGVPVSVVPLPGLTPEVYVSAVAAPTEVRPGEPFSVEVVVESTHDDEGNLQVIVDSQSIAAQHVRVARGANRFVFRPALKDTTSVTLVAHITGCKDTFAENNEASAVVSIGPKRRVLLVASAAAAAEHLAAALTANAMDVAVRPPQDLPQRLGELRDYDLLILVNVPAAAMPSGQMEVIQQYVRDSGRGLIVVGGDQTFTPGGYRGTVLEDLLPVQSHVKPDRPKPTLAMVLVIDRSDSMKGPGIELAKQATRQAVEKLGPGDQVGVLAFEDQSCWVAELQPCADKKQILEQINTLTAGGRTNMYPALDRAYLALRESYAELKHVILLSDGLSDPGDFEALAKEMRAAGITVSTVGVGPRVATQLLRDIAQLGQGRFYPCADASQVPQVFVQETISAGKVGISEGPFSPRLVRSVPLLEEVDLRQAPTLLGYAEALARPDGEVVLTSDSGAPLLAWWRCGRGTTVVFTSDAENRWAAAWLKWPGFARFWAALARHAMLGNTAQQVDAASRRVETAPSSGPRGATVAYPDELRIKPTNADLLRSIAAASGGKHGLAPAEVFAPTDRSVPRRIPLASYFLLATVCLFAIDVALKRLDLARGA